MLATGWWATWGAGSFTDAGSGAWCVSDLLDSDLMASSSLSDSWKARWVSLWVIFRVASKFIVKNVRYSHPFSIP